MLNWIKRFFGGSGKRDTPTLSDDLIAAAGDYIQLVKSRIIEALVTDHAKLLPESAPADHRFALLIALCAYFSARTDFELETRSVPEPIRDEVWPHVFETVFEEMGISDQVASTVRPVILEQMGLVRGVIETKGAEDGEAVSRTLSIIMDSAAKVASSNQAIKAEIDRGKVSNMLGQYAGYTSYLDKIASESKAYA